MGEGVEAFNLRHELVSSGPRIRLKSIRQSRKIVHYVGIVQVEDRKDIRPTIPVSIKGFHIKDALVDNGVRVSISMDFHVISLKGPSYSLVLGRPWMQELNVVQDWSKGLMTMTPSKGVDIHYDMRQQRLIEKGEDRITDYDSGSPYKSDESDENEDSSSEWEMTTSYAVLKEDDDEGGLITMQQKEKMISKDLKGQERQQFINLISEFPNLFISDYSHIRGVDVIQHHINLKEGRIPIAQKLRRLGYVQKEALLKEFKALLQASFIYHMEDLKCVSPIVLVSKKNDIDFKPLNNEVIIYARQVDVENVVCQEGIHVDEAKTKVVQKVITPTRLKTMKEFVQKVRSLERFIHMLTFLILSRVMYRMNLLLFGELTKT